MISSASLGFLEVATAIKDLLKLSLLHEAANDLLLLQDAFVAIPSLAGSFGHSQALPLISSGPRNDFLPPPILLEAAVAFVKIPLSHKVLSVNTRVSKNLQMQPQAPVASPPCDGTCY